MRRRPCRTRRPSWPRTSRAVSGMRQLCRAGGAAIPGFEHNSRGARRAGQRRTCAVRDGEPCYCPTVPAALCLACASFAQGADGVAHPVCKLHWPRCLPPGHACQWAVLLAPGTLAEALPHDECPRCRPTLSKGPPIGGDGPRAAATPMRRRRCCLLKASKGSLTCLKP